ncbi:MAG: tyrosine-type recombinase/integrase [Bacillota bacterium]
MSQYKDAQRGTWMVSYRYVDWRGEPKRFVKRGFKTKKEAADFERRNRLKESSNLDMPFSEFVDIYLDDIKSRVRVSTYETKENIIKKKIVPYFKDMKINYIEPRDIVHWQNEIIESGSKNGTPYSPVYLKTIHNQITAIFNHAVRLYDLKANPTHKAGSMGRKKTQGKKFWTQDEYLQFAKCAMDDPEFYYACEILYWCGLRVSELLALTIEDFDFKKSELRIEKGFQRRNGEDRIGEVKTFKSYRYIVLPDFLIDEIKDFIQMHYNISSKDRLFRISAVMLRNKVTKYAEIAGVKRITIHEFRHSHISLLIEIGFTALAIADRVGHESTEITNGYSHLFPNKQNEMAEKLSIVRGGK